MSVGEIRKRYRDYRNIMEDPEVKKMYNWMNYANLREEPKQHFPCFQSPFHVPERSYDTVFSLGYNQLNCLHRRQMLYKFITKRVAEKKELRKLKKEKKLMKKLKREKKEHKKKQKVNSAETEAKDVGGVEDVNVNRGELMLDVSAGGGAQVEHYRSGNLMVEGLKSCTTEAGKKTSSHSEGGI